MLRTFDRPGNMRGVNCNNAVNPLIPAVYGSRSGAGRGIVTFP